MALWIKTPDTYTDEHKNIIKTPGENRSVILGPGDGMVYKGCERPHWRDPMPTPRRRKRDIILRRKGKNIITIKSFFITFFKTVKSTCAFEYMIINN